MLSYFINLPLAFLTHLSSVLLFLKKPLKKNSRKKVFGMKTSACRDETLKNQPNKMGTTRQHIHTIPTSCAILPTMLTKKLFTHSLNEHGTQHHSLHGVPHKRQSTSATFISNKFCSTPYDPSLLTVCAYKTDFTCHAQ